MQYKFIIPLALIAAALVVGLADWHAAHRTQGRGSVKEAARVVIAVEQTKVDVQAAVQETKKTEAASTMLPEKGANFKRSVFNTLVHEGGAQYTNNPHDPGGPTKYGITLADYRLHINSKGTAKDVRELSEEQALGIYKSEYWDKVRGDELPLGLDYTLFDYGVNSGVGRAILVLHRQLGTTGRGVQDSDLKLIQAQAPSELIIKINDERLRFLKGLKTWKYFGRGWARRVASVKAISLTMNNPSRAATNGDNLMLIPRVGRGKAFSPETAE